METIADIMLVAGAIGASFYCFILSRRLKKFNDLENGIGGAVSVLSSQVKDLTKALDAAQASANLAASKLTDLNDRAEKTSQKLEFQMASLHDVFAESEQNNKPPESDIFGMKKQEEKAPLFVRRTTSH